MNFSGNSFFLFNWYDWYFNAEVRQSGSSIFNNANFRNLKEQNSLEDSNFPTSWSRHFTWRTFRFPEGAVRGWRSRSTGWGEQPEDVEWLDRKYQAQMVESVQELEDQFSYNSAIDRQVSNFVHSLNKYRYTHTSYRSLLLFTACIECILLYLNNKKCCFANASLTQRKTGDVPCCFHGGRHVQVSILPSIKIYLLQFSFYYRWESFCL